MCWFVLAGLIFLTPQVSEAKKKKEEHRLPSLTGTVTLIEPHFLSSTIQVKKTGKKGGLQSVRAIVNSKTKIQYKGKPFSLKEIPLHSTVRLEYERVKGVVVARTITVRRLYIKPAPSKVRKSPAKNKKTTQ